MTLPKRPLIVAVTGHGRDEDRQRSADAGINFHLLKPADLQQLLDLLQAIATHYHHGDSAGECVAATAKQHKPTEWQVRTEAIRLEHGHRPPG
jgi:CheY-like chemotaxis protein